MQRGKQGWKDEDGCGCVEIGLGFWLCERLESGRQKKKLLVVVVVVTLVVAGWLTCLRMMWHGPLE